MTPRHQVSRAAIELIKKFEGYRRRAAQLADGRWTIGYGHTQTARQGAEVSESDAEALLIYDLINVAHVVNETTFAPLTQNQFDALCCFAFNIGVENFRRSTVLRRVNEGQPLQAACAMELWRKADFEGERIVIDALVRRRSAEKTLFLTPLGGWVPAPSPVLPPRIDVDSLGVVPAADPVVVTTPMDGERAVAQREGQPPAPPPRDGFTAEQTSASEIAVVAVSHQLSQLLSEPEVVHAPAPPAPPPVEVEIPAEPAPAPVPAPQPAAPEATLDVPPIPAPDQDTVSEPPAEPAPEPVPEALPTFAGGDERGFELTPATEIEEPAPFLPAEETAAEAEPEPELFDPARQVPAEEPEPFRMPAGEPVRTLAEADPAPRLLIDDTVFDPINTYDATIADAKPFSLKTIGPLFILALLGLAFFAGGIFWGFAAGGRGGLSDPMTLVGWGLGITGILCFGAAIYMLLNRLVGDDKEDEA